MIIQTRNGYPEVVLVQTRDVSVFHKVADWLLQRLGIIFISKTHNLRGVVLEFQFAGSFIQLKHSCEHEVTIYPAAKDNATEDDKAAFINLIEKIKSE